ncbi:ADP-ribosylglycohydrolase family protein [Streptosporangium subroseum]|uniref:ADP-ribosylglycohydrolase family protein n=1 Tax=Streptosporangium subroseum TaxID=106412 RepID=UPI00343B35E1
MRRSTDDLPEYRSRVRGCLLGGALGDALGAPVEFEPIRRIRKQYGLAGLTGLVADWRGEVGLITDDTQMTLFTVEGLIRAGQITVDGPAHETGATPDRPAREGETVAEEPPLAEETAAVRRAYLRWLDTQQHSAPLPVSSAPSVNEMVRTGWLREQKWLYSKRAPGNACLSGLRHRQESVPVSPGLPGPVNPDSKGCGTVMRSAPFGLRARSARHAFDLAVECAQITHGHPTGYLAAGAFAALVHFLMEDEVRRGAEPLAQAVRKAMDLLATYPSHEETTQALHAAVSLSATGDPSPEKVGSLGEAWVAEEALAIAVYCALVHPEPGDFQRALLLSVNHSGDSDSTGAVCGNLLGAVHGETALPAEWLAHLEGRDVIVELADDFAAQSVDGHEVTEAWLRKYPGA